MINYVKGFGVSLFLHCAALLFSLWVVMDNSITEKKMLVVDFSAIALSKPNEGGVAPKLQGGIGAGQSGRVPSVSEQQPISPPEQALQSEAAFTPEPKPVITRQPEPDPTHEPVPRSTQAAGDQQFVKAQAQSSAIASAETTGGEEANFGVSDGLPAGRGTGYGSGTGTGQGLPQGYVKSNFNYILLSIRRNLRYPDYARRERLTGTARFTFVIKQDGNIENLSLKESSGHDILDEAAEKAIRQAAPFSRPPEPALLVIPINFRLN